MTFNDFDLPSLAWMRLPQPLRPSLVGSLPNGPGIYQSTIYLRYILESRTQTPPTDTKIKDKMVSTRGHPKEFPEPDLTPTKTPSSRGRKSITSSGSSTSKWAHTPSNLIILWLLVSVPLVSWDIGYVMLRPHSMAGGKWQWPLWMPYELYAKVDYIYGWPAFDSNNGFTAAQTALNIVESLMYVYYLYILYAHGKRSYAANSETLSTGILGRQRSVEGQTGILALLIGYSAAVMTTSKTLLYCKFA